MKLTTCLDCGREIAAGGLRCLMCGTAGHVRSKPQVRPSLIVEIPQRLYDAEINWTVSAFFDDGFRWSLWGQSETIRGDSDTYAQALRAMADAAAERNPDGGFARWWKARE